MGPTAADTAVRDGDAASREFVRAAPPPGGGVVSAVGYRSRGRRPALHRGLPSPYLTLIFSLDGPVTTGRTPAEATGPDAVRTDIVVGGLHQSPAYVVQPEHEAGIQLAVHPLAARALLGLPAAERTHASAAMPSGSRYMARSTSASECMTTSQPDSSAKRAAMP